MSESRNLGESLLQSIRQAFPDSDPPGEDEIISDGLASRDPYAATELRRLMLGRRWTSLTPHELVHHADWLVYLTPKAFIYYLPAWLVYAMDFMNADYPAQFVLGYLINPQTRYRVAMNDGQRQVLKAWYEWIKMEYPEEGTPDPPDYVLIFRNVQAKA